MKFCSVIVLGDLMASSGFAGDLIYDNFRRGTETNQALLDGSTPCVLKTGQEELWVAKNWVTDGEGAITDQAKDNSCFLPFTPEEGKVYELSANITIDETTLSDNWIGIAYSPSNSVDAHLFNLKGAGHGMLVVNNGTVRFLARPNRGVLTDSVTCPVNITVVLDTTAPVWTMGWKVNGIAEGVAEDLPSDMKINYVGFGGFLDAKGRVQDFRLKETTP